MNLNEYIDAEHKSLNKFRNWYAQEAQTKPKDFPMDQEPQDWWEQYIAWVQQ